MLIQTTEALVAFCDALRGAPYLAVDTEFLRERTYYARLCLVQVAHGEHAAAIDALSPDLDLAPLADRLADAATVKVLHAAEQDLAIFLRAFGVLPSPVFDTQIAATVCGQGEQPGYARLAQRMLGVTLDKSAQATDWSRRPLTARQVDYAIGDVTHLCRIYELLTAKLDESGRGPWITAEMERLADPARYEADPRVAWRRIRARHAKPRDLAALRELAAWRERAARSRDTPRGWVVRDEALVEIAQHRPESAAALARVRGLKSSVAHSPDGEAMLAAVRRALESDRSTWPAARRGAPPESQALVALLQALLRLRCDEHRVSTGLVASRKDLERIAVGDPSSAALRGWRRVVFGDDALALVAGRLALAARDGEVITVAL